MGRVNYGTYLFDEKVRLIYQIFRILKSLPKRLYVSVFLNLESMVGFSFVYSGSLFKSSVFCLFFFGGYYFSGHSVFGLSRWSSSPWMEDDTNSFSQLESKAKSQFRDAPYQKDK